MKKIMNAPERFVAESLEGLVRAHEDLVVFGGERKFIRRRHLAPGKVAVISGGGAGHEPLHSGFVGHGMLDAACTGHVFTSPTPDQIVAAMDETDTGAGCLLIVKNYDGDVMNFEMAAEMAASRHAIETVIVEDDAATGPAVRSRGRRGVAGTIVVEKLLGAAAERGAELGALKELGEGLNARIRSMGVALRGVAMPNNPRETFDLGPEEMEIGVGIHGEPGLTRTGFADADAIIRRLGEAILAELPPELLGDPDLRPLLLVNGFGGTPPIELYLAYGLARRFFEAHGIVPVRSLTGTFVTSLDMAGLSLTLALLTPDQLALWGAPVATPALSW
ncbi:dihydroxyacetone kinase subunit DhaK [Ancylobacter defluvii]|uniref:Dihydroxyacetone kinase subunit DhaK n=1 Tax=Ancylobacter defluvii TaxID=1282440 RepID=A0A9W6JTJ0_9HYPH|nr:dihydroxyacetone kinase subunit DhaK [Ancylobacter defluvii]MBS7586144.1 dihydroxyacetone kinase subunit DhaK [Ancylobacter defluvii]GLK82341.1 dihydroxyacetone kinase subunit DhaK [Ancylobacter defluvii]